MSHIVVITKCGFMAMETVKYGALSVICRL